ncbi:MAG: AMP-binding protein [Chloroflexi bacterium]|nr:AMP-binding protein [Chloroflexota bacterium]
MRSARDRGDAPALLGPDGVVRWTFAGLAAVTGGLAATLRAAGLQPGERVVLLAPDPAAALAVIAACLWTGAAVVVPPAAGGVRERLAVVAGTAPAAVVASPWLWPLAALQPGLRRARLRFSLGATRLPGLRPLAPATTGQEPPVARDAADSALLSFTSGTTARPKPVHRAHGVLRGQHDALTEVRRPVAGEVDLIGLPLFVLHNLGAGVVSLLPPRGQPDGAALLATVRHGRPVTAVGFPSLFAALAAAAGLDSLAGLRAMAVGGAPVRPALVQRLQALAPAARITIAYACTEVEPIATIEAADYLAAVAATPTGGLCVGQPVAGLDLAFAPLPGAPAGAGRLIVSGRRVAGNPTPHDTGDVARLDDQGRLWLLGRAAQIAPGGPVPAVVEPVVETLPWVEAAALVVVDTGQGPRPVLAVAAAGSARQRAAHIAALAEFVVWHTWPIAGVAVLGDLPGDRRSRSKVDLGRLAAMLAVPGRVRWLAAGPGA